MDSPPFSLPCGPEHFELLLPQLLLGTACVTAGNSAVSPQQIPGAHPWGTARPPHVGLRNREVPWLECGRWHPPEHSPVPVGQAQPPPPESQTQLQDLHCGPAGFSIPDSFMSRARLWVLQSPFLEHLGPQNFNHDPIRSLKEKPEQHRPAGKLGCSGEALKSPW